MLADFDFEGDLPSGIHSASLPEIEARFGKFITSDQRLRLFAKFKELVSMVKASGIVETVFIGGSFITAKEKPNDIDIVIIIAKETNYDDLIPSQLVITDRVALNRIFPGGIFDVIVVRDSTRQMQAVIEFFQTNRNNKPIGIVKVEF